MEYIELSGEQASIARSNKNGVMVCRGAAGSGKTLVAVNRAIYLATEYPYKKTDDRILFTFYNKSLQEEIECLFRKNPNYEKIKNKIKIVNIDSLLHQFIYQNDNFFQNLIDEGKLNGKYQVVFTTERDKKRLIKIINRMKNAKFREEDVDFVLEEIDWLRQLLIEDEYVGTNRIGRGNRKKLGKEEKEQIIEILKLYRTRSKFELTEYKKGKRIYYSDVYFDYHDLRSELINYINNNPNGITSFLKYNHIVADESQDFSRVHFEFLKNICNISETSPNTISFFLDASQSVYPKQAYLFKEKRNIKQLGFSKIDYPQELKTNYRNIREIFIEAKKLLDEEMDNEGQNPKLYDTDDVGLRPIMVTYQSSEEELEETYRKIMFFINKLKYNFSDITIISPEGLENIEKFFKNKKIPCAKNNQPDGGISEYINITTFFSVKGTEDKIVFILSLNNGSFEKSYKRLDKTPDENFTENKKLLYVGMTRTREILIMSHYKEKARELENLDFNNFLNIGIDDDFEMLFNKEYNSSSNINSENPRYKKIIEQKEKEEKALSFGLEEFVKEVREEQKNKVIEKEKKEEKNVLSISYDDISNKVRNLFPGIGENTACEIIEGEYHFSKFTEEDKKNERINFLPNLLPYFRASEIELKEICRTLIKTSIDLSHTGFGGLITELKKIEGTYPDLSQITKLALQNNAIEIRNNVAHIGFKMSFTEANSFRNFMINNYIKKILSIKRNLIVVNQIDGTVTVKAVKSEKNMFKFVINESILAISKYNYEYNKSYRFYGKYQIIKNERYFVVEKASTKEYQK